MRKINHAEIYTRYDLTHDVTTASQGVFYQNLMLLDSSAFSMPISFFHESTGQNVMNDNQCLVQLMDNGTNETFNTPLPLPVSNSNLSFPSTAEPIRSRSGALALTGGHRFLSQIFTGSGGVCQISQPRVVISF